MFETFTNYGFWYFIMLVAPFIFVGSFLAAYVVQSLFRKGGSK